MSDARQPYAVFVCATRAHVQDAVTVAAHLRGACWLVTLRIESAEFVRASAPPPNVVVLEGGRSTTRLGKLGTLLRTASLAWRAVRSGRRPVFVFGDDVNSIEAALVRLVRLCRAPSMLVQDGLLYDYDIADSLRAQPWLTRLSFTLLRQLRIVSPRLTMYGTGGCDVVALYSEHSCDLLQRHQVDRRSMRVVGAPRFDELIRIRRVRSPQEESGSRARVLYLGVMLEPWGGGSWHTDQYWVNAVCTLAARYPQWDVVIRPHPSESMAGYTEHLAHTDASHVSIDRESPLSEILQRTSVVVVHHPSTVLYEAMVLGVPVVYLQIGVNEAAAEEIPGDVVPRTSSGTDLAHLVATMIEGGPTRTAWLRKQGAYVEDRLGFLDGNSGQRVAALIEEEWMRMNAG